jgi:hypothetical protein
MEPEKSKKVSITDCARCSVHHDDLEFKPFNGLPIVDEDGTVWDWWAVCPITGDPVLLRHVAAGGEDNTDG